MRALLAIALLCLALALGFSLYSLSPPAPLAAAPTKTAEVPSIQDSRESVESTPTAIPAVIKQSSLDGAFSSRCSPENQPETLEIKFTLQGLLHRTTDDKLRDAVTRILQEPPDSESRRIAVRAARALAPQDPALGWEMAALSRSTAELDEAIEGLDAYLARDSNPPVARMRSLLRSQRDLQREYFKRERAGTTLLYQHNLLSNVQADDLLHFINQSLDDAARLTGTPRRSALTVVVYPSRAELLQVTCVRSWTAGLFDGTLRLISSPSPAGVDLTITKHETLHAQMTRHAMKAPRWFHEGTAQSFAEQHDRRVGWKRLVEQRTWIPFSSLNDSFQELVDGEDAGLAYIQAYAMVEMLRDCGGATAIARAIESFQKGENTDQVLARICNRPEVTGADLLTFMSRD